MDDDVCLFVTSRISTLLKAISNAGVSQTQVDISEVTESAMRTAWDDIIKAACSYPTETLSESYLSVRFRIFLNSTTNNQFSKERSIMLPKNQGTDLGSLFPREDQAVLLHDLLLAQYNSAAATDLPTSVYQDIHNSHGDAIVILGSMRSKPKDFGLRPDDRAYEPAEAIVDGLWCIDYNIAKPADEQEYEGNAVAQWTSSFLKLSKNIPVIKKTCKDMPKADTQAKTSEENHGNHRACLICPYVSESLPTYPPLWAMGNGHTFPKLYLPFIFSEYKRSPNGLQQAFYQIQMYCIFGVEFLAALGVSDTPVWGVVTGGTEGSVIMAWKSTMSDEVQKPSVSNPKKRRSKVTLFIFK